MSKKSLGCGISLSIVVFILFFACLEISARVYLNYFATGQEFQLYASLNQLKERYKQPKFSPHRYLGHYLTPSYKYKKNRHNSLGYRGEEIPVPKPKGEYRIVCIGGSTTYTWKVMDYRKSYPSLLEEQLKKHGYGNVRVINSGVGGWGSLESLINFELRVLDLEPDMIIIYHGINDIHLRLVWPPEKYKGDNARYAEYSKILMPGIWEYSTLLRYFMVKAGWTISHNDLEKIFRTNAHYYGKDFELQKKTLDYPEGIFKKISARKMFKTNKPVFFKRNIKNIAVLADFRKIKTMIATFAYSPYFKGEPRCSSEEYIGAFKETNKILKEVAKETGVYLFDFARVFPKEKEYYTDGRHLNYQGAKLKAELFARFIRDNRLIPGPWVNLDLGFEKK